MTILRIYRPNEYINRLRKYRLIVDGKEIGTIENEQKKIFNISPGQHSIIAKIDWCSCKKHTFTVNDNETKTFRIEGFKNAKWLPPLTLGLVIITLISTRYSFLRYISYLLIPLFLVFLYYFTIGYNKYLVLEEMETKIPADDSEIVTKT